VVYVPRRRVEPVDLGSGTYRLGPVQGAQLSRYYVVEAVAASVYERRKGW
jgi:hypothetical protein